MWFLSSQGINVTQIVGATGIPDVYWHLMEFAGFGFLVAKALSRSKPNLSLAEGWGLAISFVLIYAVVDELHQQFVPDRGFDLQDMLGDVAGAVVGVTVVLLWRIKRGVKR